MPNLRLGLIEEIATLPLVYPLKAGWVELRGAGTNLEAQTVSAATAAEMLDDDRLDAALIPSSDYPLRARSLRLLPFGLTSGKRGNTALVGLRRIDLLDQERVAIGLAANPAQPLLRVLLKRYFTIEMTPRAEELPWRELSAQEGLGVDDWEKIRATLLLGDEALAALAIIPTYPRAEKPEQQITAEDLNRDWWIMSGVTYTAYLLAVRRDYAEANRDAIHALVAGCRDAIRIGNEQRASILQVAGERARAAGFEMNPPAAADFYAEQRFEFTPALGGALMAFYSYASALKLIPQPAALNFVE
jgi:predicted solute-binding protein